MCVSTARTIISELAREKSVCPSAWQLVAAGVVCCMWHSKDMSGSPMSVIENMGMQNRKYGRNVRGTLVVPLPQMAKNGAQYVLYSQYGGAGDPRH